MADLDLALGVVNQQKDAIARFARTVVDALENDGRIDVMEGFTIAEKVAQLGTGIVGVVNSLPPEEHKNIALALEASEFHLDDPTGFEPALLALNAVKRQLTHLARQAEVALRDRKVDWSEAFLLSSAGAQLGTTVTNLLSRGNADLQRQILHVLENSHFAFPDAV